MHNHNISATNAIHENWQHYTLLKHFPINLTLINCQREEILYVHNIT